MIIPTPLPTQWHCRPRQRRYSPCPFCGCSAMVCVNGRRLRLGQHRLLKPLVWEVRRKSSWGWQSLIVDRRVKVKRASEKRSPGPGSNHHVGPMAQTLGRIKQAAALVAQGLKTHEVGQQLGIGPEGVRHLRERYPDLWKTALAEVKPMMEEIFAKTRAMAGTDAICAAPEPYFRLAAMVEKEAAAAGKDLYEDPKTGGIPLLEFLHKTYLPAKLGISPMYRQNLVYFVFRVYRWAGRALCIEELTDDLCNQYLGAMRAIGLAPATVNNHRKQLLALWRMAWRKRLVEEQPRDVARMKEPKRLPTAWTTAQVSRLMAECQRQTGMVGNLPAGVWWSSLVSTCYWTSARIGAVLQVHSEDLNLDEGTLTIQAEATKTQTEQFYRLGSECTELIALIYDPQRELVWPWPYQRREIFKRVRKIIEAAGLPCLKTGRELFHRLRRTSLTYLAAVSIDMARTVGGHTTDAVTIRHYIDPRIAFTRSAADVLPRLLPYEAPQEPEGLVLDVLPEPAAGEAIAAQT